MSARLLADATLVLHLLFILYVALGGLLVLRWPRSAWLHLPVLAWGITVEAFGLLCPLTTLENHWRTAAGEAGYAGGFVEHYLWPIVYPAGLTRDMQFGLAVALLLVNALVYTGVVLLRRRRQ